MSDLNWALLSFASPRMNDYAVYRNYYYGNQKLAFATEKFRNTFGALFKEFAENASATVVDSLGDRLTIEGFTTNQASVSTEDQEVIVKGVPPRKLVVTNDPVADTLLEFWNDQKMHLVSTTVHEEAIREGDGYVVVWPDEEGNPVIWPQMAGQCSILYDTESKYVIRGTKRWFDVVNNQWCLNLYYVDRIEKYIQTKINPQGDPGTTVSFPNKENMWSQRAEVPNPYGVVPLFHFPNGDYKSYGCSSLKDIVPLQDGLNKSVMDMMIAMEFASFRQRYVIGLELEMDEQTGTPKDPGARQYGVDRLLTFPDIDTKVGEFDTTDLQQFLRVQDKFWISCSRVSGTPLHYFFITTGDFPSGEAMKAAEARFVKRITDRQVGVGAIWEEVLGFCLQIQGTSTDGLKINITWKDATSRSDNEIADTAVKKKAVGVSRTQLLLEMNYTPEQISRMLTESDIDELQKAMLAATLQSLLAEEVAGVQPSTTNGASASAGGPTGNRTPPQRTSGTRGVPR